MNKLTARRLAAATAFTVPGAMGVAGVAHAGATFLTPRANTAVGGKTVTIYAQFTAPRPVVAVKLFLDNILIAQRAFRPSGVSGTVNFVWDSTVATTGAHRVTLKMYDRAGQVAGTQSIPISVVNGGAIDTVPPQVTIITPSPNAGTHGTFDVKVLATDNSGEAPYVSLFVDKELRSVSNRQPYSVTVDTTEYTNGSHTLEAWAYDTASNKGTATPVSFRVNNIGGATTLNNEVNPSDPAPIVEQVAPTGPALAVVPDPAPAASTAPLPVTPVVKPAKTPVIAKPLPKPVPKIAAPKVLIARAATPKPAIAALPEPTLQEVLDAAPNATVEPETAPGAIAELPIETITAVAAGAPPVVIPVMAPLAPKPIVVPPEVRRPDKPAPLVVLKNRGDKVIEATPALKTVPAKPVPRPRKTMVAKAIQIEAGNPAPAPKLIAKAPRTTAPVVKAHANPAPVKVSVAPKPAVSHFKPVIVRELPADRAHRGRIMHAIRPGETPQLVAHRYGVPLKRLMAANWLSRRSELRVGQMVTVPSPVRVAFNNEPIQFDVAPRIQNGVTTAALRQICEAAGAKVDWDARTREVRISGVGPEIVVRVGSHTATVNGQRVVLETAASLRGGRTLVPVRFLTEALRLNADYDLRSGEIALSRR